MSGHKAFYATLRTENHEPAVPCLACGGPASVDRHWMPDGNVDILGMLCERCFFGWEIELVSGRMTIVRGLSDKDILVPEGYLYVYEL